MKKLLTILLFSSITALHAQDELPEQFKPIDKNSDGFIQVEEVQTIIDGFFIGLHDHGVMFVHNLIDYFFEQK